MILSDLLGVMVQNPSPSKDPTMDRSWDLLQYAKRGVIRRGGCRPALNVELNELNYGN